jgi:hypothetical protein
MTSTLISLSNHDRVLLKDTILDYIVMLTDNVFSDYLTEIKLKKARQLLERIG